MTGLKGQFTLKSKNHIFLHSSSAIWIVWVRVESFCMFFLEMTAFS